MLKWLNPDGSVQLSKCGRYVAMRANGEDWVAYHLTPFNTGEKLAEVRSDSDARAYCESHARAKRAA